MHITLHYLLENPKKISHSPLHRPTPALFTQLTLAIATVIIIIISKPN